MNEYRNNSILKMMAVLGILFSVMSDLSARDFYISFKPAVSGTPIDSILVINLKTNQRVKLLGSDSLLLTTPANGIPSLTVNVDSGYLYPNPCKGDATLTFTTSKSEKVDICIYSVSGQLLYQTTQNLAPGFHHFLVKFPSDGIFYLSVMKRYGAISYKAVCTGGQFQINQIVYKGSEKLSSNEVPNLLKSALTGKTMTYSTGDNLLCSVFSDKSNTILTDSPIAMKVYTVEFYRCNDTDNNSYPVIKIGNQWWMARNLQTTKYSDGTAIPNVTDNSSWATQITGARCWYNNDSMNGSTYGALYNWYAAVDNRKLCPVGWHVPTDAEWSTLENYLIANAYNYDGTTTGNKIAKSMAAKINWNTYSGAGTVGNTDYPAYRNKSGFSALPGGYCPNYGGFAEMGDAGVWWSSTDTATTSAIYRYLGYSYNYMYRNNFSKQSGFSVRCVRDPISSPSLTTNPVTGITQSTASGGGEVTFDGWAMVISKGVCWNTTGSPTIADNKTIDGSGMGTFTNTMTGLTAITTYYVRAYGTNSQGTAYGNQVTFNTTGIINDVENNIYKAVKIGNQVWMAENLKTTKYRDGTTIPNVTDNSSWLALTTGAWCWYNNNAGNKSTYGAVYNWYAAVDNRKLCPLGWHVPTDAEWTTLEIYLQNNGYNFDGSIDTDNDRSTNDKTAKSLAAITNWNSDSGKGSVGNTDYPAYRNKTGFSALPGGYRVYIDGSFWDIGIGGLWWSYTAYSSTSAWYRSMSNVNAGVSRYYLNKPSGLYIRCLRD